MPCNYRHILKESIFKHVSVMHFLDLINRRFERSVFHFFSYHYIKFKSSFSTKSASISLKTIFNKTSSTRSYSSENSSSLILSNEMLLGISNHSLFSIENIRSQCPADTSIVFLNTFMFLKSSV